MHRDRRGVIDPLVTLECVRYSFARGYFVSLLIKHSVAMAAFYTGSLTIYLHCISTYIPELRWLDGAGV